VSRGKMVMKPEFGKTVRVNISSKWADNMDCGMWGSKQNIRDWATEALLEQHNIDWSSYSFKQVFLPNPQGTRRPYGHWANQSKANAKKYGYINCEFCGRAAGGCGPYDKLPKATHDGCVVMYRCTANWQLLAHEMGHNFGLAHDVMQEIGYGAHGMFSMHLMEDDEVIDYDSKCTHSPGCDPGTEIHPRESPCTR
jgi:hypothetical protein